MKQKSKNYYRKITESLPQTSELNPKLMEYFTFFFALLAVFLVFYLAMLGLKYIEVREQRLKASDNLAYWENVVRKHPNFTDGYYYAGLYSYQLGYSYKALAYLDRAIELDPEFDKAIRLEKKIEE